MTIAFLGASFALFSIGGFRVIDSGLKLMEMEHPSVGTMHLFGRDVWLGWVMIAALVYSAIPPIVLGRLEK